MLQGDTIWARAGVIALCGIFAVITLGVMVNIVPASGWYNPSNPYATTDAFLAILGVPHPGMLIDRALQPYPQDKPLLFVAPATDGYRLQVYYSIAHLAYPRAVSAVSCGERGKGATEIIDRFPRSTELSGVFFLEVDPGPWASGGTRVTQKLFLSPYRAIPASWESFCQ